MNNLFHIFLIFVSAIVVGLGIGSSHKIQQSTHNKVVLPTVAVSSPGQPTKVISEDEQIQKQAYEAYQKCLADEKKSNPCTIPFSKCTLPTPTPSSSKNEEAYQEQLYQAQCQLSCQKKQQTYCYDKFYGANSNALAPKGISIPE